MKKALLFDFGGTLDTDGIHWSELFWRAYSYYAIPITKEDFRNAFIYSERNIPNLIKSDFNLIQTYKMQLNYQFNYLEESQLLSAFYFVLFDDIANYLKGYVYNNLKTSIQLLKQLQQQYKIGLVSNYYGNLETILKEIDIKQYFATIIDSTNVGFRKPDVKIFLTALEKLNAYPQETIVIGDSYDKDIIPAKKIGCNTILLNGESWNKFNDLSSADIIIHSIKELPDILSKITN